MHCARQRAKKAKSSSRSGQAKFHAICRVNAAADALGLRVEWPLVFSGVRHVVQKFADLSIARAVGNDFRAA